MKLFIQQIVRSRIERTFGPFVWNRPPGGLYVYPPFSQDLSDLPFYSPSLVTRTSLTGFTAVITGKRKEAPKILDLIGRLCTATSLRKVGYWREREGRIGRRERERESWEWKSEERDREREFGRIRRDRG